MFGGGGGGGAPAPAPVVQRPKETDPDVQKAAAEAIRRKATARGYRSTILASMLTDQQKKATFGA